MKRIGLLTFLFYLTQYNAEAVVLYPALTNNPKKAEEFLILQDRARLSRLAERRNEMIKKHALKKAKVEVRAPDKAIADANSTQLQPQVATELSVKPNQRELHSEVKETVSQ